MEWKISPAIKPILNKGIKRYEGKKAPNKELIQNNE